jgi:monoamine oxidase
VAIFEGSGRIGGRLLSVKAPGMERLVGDLGGAYFANTHRTVAALVEKLGLRTEPIPLPVRNVFHLRGARLRSDSPSFPYSFAPGEDPKRRDAFFVDAIEKLISGITRAASSAREDVLEEAFVDGRPLTDWGFWNLLQRGMSAEAFRYTRDTRPDDYNFSNWNAADALRALLGFGRDTRMFHCVDGYGSLPLSLCRSVQDAGGDVLLGHRLVGLETEQDGGIVRLHLARGGHGWGPGADGDRITVRARSVVLALPRRSLELLDSSGPLFEARGVSSLLASVTPIPMFKTFACYPSPWWRELGFTSGFAITDLPLRTSFYWGTEEDLPGQGGAPTSRRSLLMASLSYLHEATFWAGLRSPSHAPPRAVGGSAALARAPWEDFEERVDGPLAMELQRQLSEVHGIEVPRPYAVACADWGAHPYGGAVNFWNPGARSKDLMPRIAHPVAGLPIYICGEAYSRDQGWVEGALATSEHVLQTHYRLRKPDWLTTEPRRQA